MKNDIKQIRRIISNIPKVLQYRAYDPKIIKRVENDLLGDKENYDSLNIFDIYSLDNYLHIKLNLQSYEATNIIYDAVQIYLNEMDK